MCPRPPSSCGSSRAVGLSEAAAEMQEARVACVWQRHPVPGVAEQPVHFVRYQTDLRKSVEFIGLEDSYESHRGGRCRAAMHDQPWDRCVLVNVAKNYEDLRAHFPRIAHYWNDPQATFGEQLCLDGDGIDMDTLCVGDILESSYDSLRLQVCSPRLTCFRVDERYPADPPIKYSGQPGTVRQWCGMNARAGFFCRVLRPGSVQEGDALKIIKRPHPEWPLSRIAGTMYGKTPVRLTFSGTDAELEQLANMEDLASYEWRERLQELLASKVDAARSV